MDHRAEGTSRYSEQIAKAAKSHISICRFEGWATEAYRISISRVHVSIASRVSVGVKLPKMTDGEGFTSVGTKIFVVSPVDGHKYISSRSTRYALALADVR